MVKKILLVVSLILGLLLAAPLVAVETGNVGHNTVYGDWWIAAWSTGNGAIQHDGLAMECVTPPRTGVFNSIHVYMKATNSQYARGEVINNATHSVIAATDQVYVTSATGAWYEFTFPTVKPIATAGTTYIIGVFCNSVSGGTTDKTYLSVAYRSTGGSGAVWWDGGSTFPSVPASQVYTNQTGWDFSIWAGYNAIPEDSTALTIVNSTGNVTGNYTQSYSATTGWTINLNFFGEGGGGGFFNAPQSISLKVSLAFLFLGLIAFVVAFFEERRKTVSLDRQDQQAYMVIIFFAFATFFFIISGVTIMYSTYNYVDQVTGVFHSVLLTQYWPFGWFLVGLGGISLIFLVAKIIDIRWNQ